MRTCLPLLTLTLTLIVSGGYVIAASRETRTTIPRLSLEDFRAFVSDGTHVCVRHTFRTDRSFEGLNERDGSVGHDHRELHASQRRRTGTMVVVPSTIGGRGMSEETCAREGGEWTEIVGEDDWDRRLDEVDEEVSRFWDGHARRHLLSSSSSEEEEEEERKSLYMIELEDDVTLSKEQFSSFQTILGDKLQTMFRKKKGDTGDGMIQVYTSWKAIEDLYETYGDVVRTVSPFPSQLKVTSYLRASTATHVTQSLDTAFEVNVIVFLSSGAMEDSSSSIEEIATQFERLCEDEDPVDDVPYEFQVHGKRQITLTVTTTLGHIRDLAELLATDARVSRVTLQAQYENLNFHGSGTLQVGSEITGTAADFVFHAAGITGKDQIVGVGDSGLDYGHCMFRDGSNLVTGPNGANLQTGETYNNANARKIVQYVAYADAGEDEDAGHGTHVAGSVAGNPTTGGNCACDEGQAPMKGQAYEAKIAMYDIGRPGEQFLRVPPDVYSTMCQNAYDIGAKIHTNSWGSPSNFYSSGAYGFDLFSYDHQDFLVLVAAGNSGGATAADDGTVGAPATGKNILSVGAGTQDAKYWTDTGRTCTDCDDNDLAYFTSRGPAFDDRYKPEAISPGMLVRSARSSGNGRDAQSCEVVDFQGTSMATPLLAGTAALVRDYFESGTYPLGEVGANEPLKPMGALVKAVLLNSAQDISTAQTGGRFCIGYTCNNNGGTIDVRPSNQQGFGRVQIGAALPFEQGKLFAVGKCPDDAPCTKDANTGTWPASMTTVAQSETMEYEIDVKSVATYFKVTLVWHGPVTETMQNVLINDLDLTLTDPDGTEYLPLAKNGGTAAVDNTNNVEQIYVTFDAGTKTGKWTVKVSGTSVSTAHSPQPFALAVNSDFELDSVTNNGGDSLNALLEVNGGALAGAIVGVFFLLLIAFALCYKIRGGPALDAVMMAVLHLTSVAVAMAEAIIVSDIENGDWRNEGTFGLSIAALLVYFGLAVLGVLCIFNKISISTERRSVLFAVVDGLFVALWMIFVPSIASLKLADATMIILAFLLMVLSCVGLVLFFTSHESGNASQPKSTSTRKKVPPSTRPKKPKKKTPPKLKPKPKTPKKPKKKALAKGATVKAKWAYRAQQSDELSLKKGELVKVLSVQGDGWVYGTSQKTYQKGMFPGNYVVVV